MKRKKITVLTNYYIIILSIITLIIRLNYYIKIKQTNNIYKVFFEVLFLIIFYYITLYTLLGINNFFIKKSKNNLEK